MEIEGFSEATRAFEREVEGNGSGPGIREGKKAGIHERLYTSAADATSRRRHDARHSAVFTVEGDENRGSGIPYSFQVNRRLLRIKNLTLHECRLPHNLAGSRRLSLTLSLFFAAAPSLLYRQKLPSALSRSPPRTRELRRQKPASTSAISLA